MSLAAAAPLLRVDGLSVDIRTESGAVAVVETVSFSIAAGRTLGLVGESGCGKSVTALAMTRLLPEPPARIAAGRIRFDGVDLLALRPPDIRRVRGDRCATASVTACSRAGRMSG